MDKPLVFITNGLKASFLSLISLGMLLVVSVPLLIFKIIKPLRRFIHLKSFKQEKEVRTKNPPIPEQLVRRPDPCLYSQTYLQSQGFPVTWNNPDIWLTRLQAPNTKEYGLDTVEAGSVLQVQVHNASTDPALGVKIRLLYRSWGFNAPEWLPVETDSLENEVLKIINVAAMSSAVVSFKWRMPNVAASEIGHAFCFQAVLFHPQDTNALNNSGQRNVHVLSAAPAQSCSLFIPLYNTTPHEQTYFIHPTNFQIDPARKIVLKRKTDTGRQKETLENRFYRMIPLLKLAEKDASGTRSVRLEWSTPVTVTRAKYGGLDEIRKELLTTDFSVPEAWQLSIHHSQKEVRVAAESKKDIELSFTVPADVRPGEQFSINVACTNRDGVLTGGVTILVHIQ